MAGGCRRASRLTRQTVWRVCSCCFLREKATGWTGGGGGGVGLGVTKIGKEVSNPRLFEREVSLRSGGFVVLKQRK